VDVIVIPARFDSGPTFLSPLNIREIVALVVLLRLANSAWVKPRSSILA